ncbi:Natural killer cells antigen CD94 [Tupaia chinensis]|uniref:Natural killer cells antigen CD94 n=1 Tax=Tupaia chinensis TaxID=246437 RepID=L9L918_TUPCH|nr:Natural killer cells antigen CD94 [Tupaia chinensis]
MTEGPLIYATLKQNSQQKFVTKDNIKNKLSANELLLMKEKQKRHKQKVHRNIAEDITEKDSGDAFYWIGLSYSQEREAWLWENGSALSQDLFPLSHTLNPKNCIVYARKNILDEPCGRKNRYICKQQLI